MRRRPGTLPSPPHRPSSPRFGTLPPKRRLAWALLLPGLLLPSPVAGQAGAGAPGDAAGPRLDDPAWVNFDFVAGDRVLFFEDFEADRVGNFPRRLEFVNGNMEVALWQERRFLRVTSPAVFQVPLPEELPDRFSLEFEVHQPHASHSLIVATGEARPPHLMGVYEGGAIHVDRVGTGVKAYGGSGGEGLATAGALQTSVPHLRVMGDGRYVKVYVDEDRVANVPNADLARTREITFIVGWADPEEPQYIGPIRVAAGGAPIYDALMEDGRFTTLGILFATGSDRMNQESLPVLREIGETLQRHPDLRVRIEGHTDSVGSPEANQALSERRAEAVRRFLIEQYGIGEDRLEAVGMGEEHPVDTNDTPEGRQNNRRVVLVRL